MLKYNAYPPTPETVELPEYVIAKRQDIFCIPDEYLTYQTIQDFGYEIGEEIMTQLSDDEAGLAVNIGHSIWTGIEQHFGEDRDDEFHFMGGVLCAAVDVANERKGVAV